MENRENRENAARFDSLGLRPASSLRRGEGSNYIPHLFPLGYGLPPRCGVGKEAITSLTYFLIGCLRICVSCCCARQVQTTKSLYVVHAIDAYTSCMHVMHSYRAYISCIHVVHRLRNVKSALKPLFMCGANYDMTQLG